MDYSRSGFIYVIQMEGHDYYKIGRTKKIDQRLGQITPQLPAKVRVVFARHVSDAVQMESVFHRTFKRYRLNGEWFHLPTDCLREIEADLLLSQAHRLFGRIHNHFQADYDVDTATRYARAMYHASMRRDRRMANWEVLNCKREAREAGPDILSAEFIG